ncbi:MAG: FAD-binding oxidoreductase [Desulfobacteraceae bacterium]|nr:FAD-binding oxidoreductase [Desulfobacteraceae bacterium]
MKNFPHRELARRLSTVMPAERLISDPLRTYAYATDASVYRLVPKLIVRVENEAEVLQTLAACRSLKLPLTFRAAGTSLSGQALSDSVLLLLGVKGFRDIEIGPDGDTIRLGAAVLGAQANAALAPLGKKIGPDPASVNAAKIGGIVANNACGMTSGVDHNSMGTLLSMRMILLDGTVLDTGDAGSRAAFLRERRDLVAGVRALAERVRGNPALTAKIREKYRIKNTCGYSLNALVDHEDPIDMIAHLMIGSEGTLGFISEVVFRTLPEASRRAAALMVFPDTARACEAVLRLKDCSVSAAELMDRVALRSVEAKPGMPPWIRELGDTATALLVETGADDDERLERQATQIREAFSGFPLAHDFAFTTDPLRIAQLWEIRKGIFPSACVARRPGTAVIIEDIAVPIAHLESCLGELQKLFTAYEYENPVIWGHVFDGNVHFVLTPDFTRPAEVTKYQRFMDAVVDLVVERYNGSLKAEHGTGRNMAPFVAREWGPELYAVMREIKALFDPEGLLNPGCLIDDDPEGHVRHFKAMPVADPVVDTCIECGFCERNCMSHEFTLSARQRIVVYREMTRLRRTGANPARLRQLAAAYRYMGDQTCAADGLCATSCPVEIDTGKLIKHLRRAQLHPPAHRLADWIGDHMGTVTRLTRLGLGAADTVHGLIGSKRMRHLSEALRRLSRGRLPLWTPWMPASATAVACIPVRAANPRKVVYFPSCITRSMGPARGEEAAGDVPAVTARLIRKAGYEIIYPEKMESLCCGMPFASKGIDDVADKRARELSRALLAASDNGRLPVVCDMSPCLHHMRETLDRRLRLYEPIRFTLEVLAPHLEFRKLPETVAIHTVCSAKKMGLEAPLRQLAEMCAEKVTAPEVICCGFAGDRGFTHPELNAFGLRRLAEQIPADCAGGYSTSRTCEIGLSHHSGVNYRSILYLVDRATEAAAGG